MLLSSCSADLASMNELLLSYKRAHHSNLCQSSVEVARCYCVCGSRKGSCLPAAEWCNGCQEAICTAWVVGGGRPAHFASSTQQAGMMCSAGLPLPGRGRRGVYDRASGIPWRVGTAEAALNCWRRVVPPMIAPRRLQATAPAGIAIAIRSGRRLARINDIAISACTCSATSSCFSAWPCCMPSSSTFFLYWSRSCCTQSSSLPASCSLADTLESSAFKAVRL
mmetsp:Transcript_11369/g.32285  ORF Transcript_11369/g.32285 Transcript_11369/m.32285 type:complete len:223 (-) Transcript_11369:13-681(-)